MPEERRRVETPGGPIDYVLTVKPVKNINLRLKPDGTVAVSAPRRVSKGAVDALVRERGDWIRAHQAAQAARQAAALPPMPRPETALPVLRGAMERMWPLMEPMGVKKPVLKCRRMKSRWGSCHTGKGVVVLNAALAVLPEGLQDYVALHELGHLVHPNHGAGFYALLTALMPDWQTRRKALRGYEGMLRET